MKKYNIYFLSILLFFLSSCDQGFEDLNKNPNQITKVDVSYVFSRVLVTSSSDNFEAWRSNFIYSSALTQQCASEWWSGNDYTVNDQWTGAYFDRLYTGYGKNVIDVINKTTGIPEHINILSAARIWKAYLFQKATDLYGDIPYFDAAKGVISGNFNPAYDSQEAIYADLLKELKEAAAAFDAGKSFRGDILYNGNIDKWKKFANSLRLRIGMRYSKIDPNKAQAEVTAAIAAGVMTSNDDIAKMEHSNVYTNGNSSTVQNDHFYLMATMVNFMKATNDPRLPIYGAVYTNGTLTSNNPNDYTGLPVGSQTGGDQYVRVNKTYFSQNNAPFIHMNYSEVEFLLAEAAVRGWGASNAALHYQNAITAHMKHLAMYPNSPTISDVDIAAFILANPFDNSSVNASLKSINEQLWISHFFNGYEAFANWRRSGFPVLTPSTHPSRTIDVIPRIMPYPDSEAFFNATNYNAAVTKKGGFDDLRGRVWWDKN